MTSYVTRLGRMMEADEVFHSWTSGDLHRMLAALALPTNPIDRHFLLLGIVSLTYKSRADSDSRRVCREVARRHIAEFRTIAPALAAEMGGALPRVSTFAHLATLLGEDGAVEQAIAVCEQAKAFGLHDGTKSDYAGRIERLRRKHASARQPGD